MMKKRELFKRIVVGVVAGVLVLSFLLTMLPAVFARAEEATFTQVTGADYVQMMTGGVDGALVYTAYDGDALMMGTLTKEGEQSRVAYTADGWNALFAPDSWTVTVTGDAGELCPYADTHKENTLCPYLDIDRVTLTNAALGVSLENYYIPSTAQRLLPSGSVHVCWGQYNYQSPVSLKWDSVMSGNRFALKGANGLWGVYDANGNVMLTGFSYAQMSAVCGQYVKVSNGEKWARLDLDNYSRAYLYDSEEAFSITEELHKVGENSWQVFNADNEPVSVAFSGDGASVTYAAQPHLLLMTAADGTKTMYDLCGNTVATFAANQKVRYLQDNCYAVETYTDTGAVSGIALAVANNTPTPADTVLAGDVTLDKTADTADVRLLLQYASEKAALTDRQKLAGDADGNGIIDTTDARLLLKRLITV